MKFSLRLPTFNGRVYLRQPVGKSQRRRLRLENSSLPTVLFAVCMTYENENAECGNISDYRWLVDFVLMLGAGVFLIGRDQKPCRMFVSETAKQGKANGKLCLFLEAEVLVKPSKGCRGEDRDMLTGKKKMNSAFREKVTQRQWLCKPHTEFWVCCLLLWWVLGTCF